MRQIFLRDDVVHGVNPQHVVLWERRGRHRRSDHGTIVSGIALLERRDHLDRPLICNVTLFDPETFSSHLNGKSHQKQLQRLEEAAYGEASSRVTGRRVHELPSQFEERARKEEEDKRRKEREEREGNGGRHARRHRPYDYGQYR